MSSEAEAHRSKVVEKQYLSFAVGLVSSAIFLYLALRRVTFADVFASMRSALIWPLVLTQLTKLGTFVFLAQRSKLIFQPIYPFDFITLLKSHFTSFVGNNILPLRMGELLRIAYLSNKSGQPPAACVAVFVVERMMDLGCLLSILFLSILFGLFDFEIKTTVYIMVAVISLGLSLLIWISRDPEAFLKLAQTALQAASPAINRVVLTRLERFTAGLKAMASPRAVRWAILCTFGYWTCAGLSLQLWIIAFQLDVVWYAPVVMLLFVSLGAAIPSTPGYIGTYHYFAQRGLLLFGVEATLATSVVVVGHAVSFIPFTIIGVVIVGNELTVLIRNSRLAH